MLNDILSFLRESLENKYLYEKIIQKCLSCINVMQIRSYFRQKQYWKKALTFNKTLNENFLDFFSTELPSKSFKIHIDIEILVENKSSA